MVLVGSGEERERETMAMGPERSKPLHNFTLPCLKWQGQRYLRCMKVTAADGSSAGDHRSPAATRKRELEAPNNNTNNARSSEKRVRVAAKTAIHGDDGIDAVREKLMLDLKTEADRMKDAILGKEVARENDREEDEVEEERESAPPPIVTAAESVAGVRPWNLRTRRAACKAPVGGGGESGSGKGLKIEEKMRPNTSPFRNANNNGSLKSTKLRGGAPEKMEKVNFSVPLSRKEIEEDFMGLLGHRPPRRPKKRPRIVQKQLDSLFPGLWLSEVTADSYKVPEAPENGKR